MTTREVWGLLDQHLRMFQSGRAATNMLAELPEGWWFEEARYISPLDSWCSSAEIRITAASGEGHTIAARTTVDQARAARQWVCAAAWSEHLTGAGMPAELHRRGALPW